MQIIIDETEIQAALDAYCSDRVKVPEGQKIKVTFTAGRGENGAKATIEFEDIDTPVEEANVSTPKEPVKVPKKPVKEKKVEASKEEVKEPKTTSESPSDELFKAEGVDETKEKSSNGFNLYNM
jgi:ribosomal protein L14E/L6E/L27E